MLIRKTYKTSEYEVFIKKDTGKEREIYKLPYFPDRIVHWAIIQVVEPIFLNRLNGCTHSAIPNKGIHSAFKQLDKYMRNDVEGTKYCLKLDVKKFYPSIDHNLLKLMYRTLFKDPNLLWLLDEIIDSTEGDKGVPIGNYLSQYSGNLFLSKFDRWIKEKLRVKYYIRYMDDIVILHHDKNYLRKLLKEINKYLKNINLEIKGDYQIFPSRTRGIDFVGYRHFGDYVLLRKSTSKRLIRKMRNIMKKLRNGGKLTYSDYCSINSYKGWLKWCNGYNLYTKWIKPLEPYCDKYYREVIKGENLQQC
ncbi:MAG: RNA-directed DNA polymerase [Peptococcia bacterium]